MASSAEVEVEETSSDDEWVVVGDQSWVVLKPVQKHADSSDAENDEDVHEHYTDRGDVFNDANRDRGDCVHDTETYEDGDDGDDDDGLGFSQGDDEKEEEGDDDYGDIGSFDDAHAVSCSDDGAFEDDEAEEDEDGDFYGAFQPEADKRTDSLTDAINRYYTDPVGEGWQEYVCSVQTNTRKELHATKLEGFCGFGPDPKPFMEGSNCFNPLFKHMWLPWAIDVEYCHNEDMGLFVCDSGDTGLMLRQLAAEQYMSSAVPSRPVLEYMVNRAPNMEIAHVGSCSSLYWAALLQRLGAENVIVTEGPVCVEFTDKSFHSINLIGEEMFFSQNTAGTQALFFLRPSKRSSDDEPCFAERCLFCYSGNTVFFIGETGEHADNFDMAQWVEEHKLEGWHVEREMEIPCWPGSHDVFLCITKVQMPIDDNIA